jgi:prepilin-type N-terminal cleavage/methylation domain-containing protein
MRMINTHSVLGSYRSQPARRRFSLTSGCNHHSRRGLSLIEVMLAIVITSVIAIGTLGYQYFSIKHSRASDAQYLATRIGQLLLEDWKSTGGDSDYDPSVLGLGFIIPTYPETGTYKITLDNQTFYITRTRSNASTAPDPNPDPVAGVLLLQLRVTVKWRNDYGQGAITSGDPEIILTTYVRRDG